MHRPHSKNKTWANPENHGKDKESHDDNIQEDPNLPGNRWKHLQVAREHEREDAIANKLMPDPNARYRLDEAITIKGTCEDMCPEFERHEREAKALLDPWEYVGGPQSKDKPKRIDHERAVKCYQRGSGDSFIPSDLRTPEACKRTVEYLFNLANENTLAATHAFVRDRSRAVRLDLRVQQIEDEISMTVTERCARFHILSLHDLRQLPKDRFDPGTEAEQIGQTLQSLKQFPSPFSLDHRSEFMGYYILFHIRNEPPPAGNKERSSFLRFARSFREEVKKASPAFAKRSELKISEEGIQMFTRFSEEMTSNPAALADMEELGKSEGWRRSIVYLVSSLLEFHFGEGAVAGMEERRGGLSHLDIIQCDTLPSTGVAPASATIPTLNGSVSTSSLNAAATPFVPLSFGTAKSANAFGTSGNGNTFLAHPQPQQTSSFGFGSGAFSANASSPFGSAASTSPFSRSAPPVPEDKPNAFLPSTSTSAIPASSSSHANAFGIPTTSSSTSSSAPQAPPANVFGVPIAGAAQQRTVAPSQTQQSQPTTAPTNAFGFGAGNSAFGFGSAFGGGFPISGTSTPVLRPASTAPATGLGGQATNHLQQAEQQARSPFASGDSQTKFPFTTPAPPSVPQTSPAFSLAPPPTTSRPPSTLPFSLTPSSTPPPAPATTSGISAPPPHQGTSFPSFPSLSKPQAQPNIQAPTPHPPTVSQPPTFPTQPSTNKPDTIVPPQQPSQSVFGSRPASTMMQPKPQTAAVPTVPSPLLAPPVQQSRPQPAPTPSRDVWAPDFAQREFQHLFQTAFAAMLADTLAQESYERSVRRQLQDCFKKWTNRANEICEKKAEKIESEKRRAEEWKLKQLEVAENGNGVGMNGAGMSKLKRSRMSSVISFPGMDLEQTTTNGLVISGRQVKRKLNNGMKSAAEIGEEVRKRGEYRQRHWEAGTFLKNIRDEVSKQGFSRGLSELPDKWSIILSTNTINPTSAGWLRVKFGMPFEAEKAHQNPATLMLEGKKNMEHPGLIVFECAYLEQTLPSEERSRILTEDAARLLSILKSLPKDRHYLTRLIIIVWANESDQPGETVLPMPILSTIDRLGFKDYQAIVFGGMQDAIEAFETSLSTLQFDVVGSLLKTLSVYELFNTLLKSWKKAAEDEVSWCRDIGKYNWPLAGYVVKAFIDVLNYITRITSRVLEDYSQYSIDPLAFPSFDAAQCSSPLASLETMAAYCEQIHEDDASLAQDHAEALRARRGSLENNETQIVLTFLEGLSQITKDVSDRRALRYGDSVGASEAPSIRIARTRLETITTFLEQKVKQTQAELVAVRQSLAAAHWVLVETSTASLPPSTVVSSSEDSNSPPAIRTPTPTLPPHTHLYSNAAQTILTVEDLRHPSLPSAPGALGAKLSASNPIISTPPARQSAQFTSSSPGASGLRSKAREILAKYKNRTFPDETPQDLSPPRAQSARSSSPGGRNGPSPRERRGPYDPPRNSVRRVSKTDVLTSHANGLRDSFRGSVVDADADADEMF